VAIFHQHGNWYIDYYWGTRRFREKVGPGKWDAEKALAVRLAEIVQTRYKLIPKRKVPRFEQFVPRYLDYGKANKAATPPSFSAFAR